MKPWLEKNSGTPLQLPAMQMSSNQFLQVGYKATANYTIPTSKTRNAGFLLMPGTVNFLHNLFLRHNLAKHMMLHTY